MAGSLIPLFTQVSATKQETLDLFVGCGVGCRVSGGEEAGVAAGVVAGVVSPGPVVGADTPLAMSAIISKKITGAVTVPCGTPEITGDKEENIPSTIIACFLIAGSRKAAIHIPTFPVIFALLILCRMTPFSHLSYALE